MKRSCVRSKVSLSRCFLHNFNKETNEYEYITKGDNNLIADDAPAKYSNLIGKVILRFPGLGRVQAFVGSKLGWLVVVIIPALIIIIQDVLKLIKVTKYKKIADIENERLVSEIENK